MSNTNAVEVIIHETSPLLQSKPLSPHFGAPAAGAAAVAAASGAAGAGAAIAAAGAAALAASSANTGTDNPLSDATSVKSASNFFIFRILLTVHPRRIHRCGYE